MTARNIRSLARYASVVLFGSVFVGQKVCIINARYKSWCSIVGRLFTTNMLMLKTHASSCTDETKPQLKVARGEKENR